MDYLDNPERRRETEPTDRTSANNGGLEAASTLGNCHRVQKLARCRELLGMAAARQSGPPPDYRDRFEALTGQSLRECPHCHVGVMVVIDCIARPKICQPVPDTS
jgi:hypothetical protein